MIWRSIEFRGRRLYYRDALELAALKLQILARDMRRIDLRCFSSTRICRMMC